MRTGPTGRLTGRRIGAVLAAVIVAGVTAVAQAVPAQASAEQYFLNPGEMLAASQRLVSGDGQYVLAMQTDGNLVMYAPGGRPLWASGTSVGGSDLEMQTDGNLVVYAPPRHTAVWATGTSGALPAGPSGDQDGLGRRRLARQSGHPDSMGAELYRVGLRNAAQRVYDVAVPSPALVLN
jgi:hypothetical protein